MSVAASAHPRACGENVTASDVIRIDGGSSPRVRGKRRQSRRRFRQRGLIPARAGKTAPRARSRRARPAHPRACGENHKWHATILSVQGSSPRVRGKHAYRYRSASNAGLIPARAGKTHGKYHPYQSARAHPRACGENDAERVGVQESAGSSPRVRGKHRRRIPALLHGGLIPARAGKTTRRPSPRTTPTAHPRACGENP